MVREHIDSWIDKLSLKQESLNYLKICPFAEKSKYKIIFSDGDIEPPTYDFSLMIYILESSLTFVDLLNLAKSLKEKYPHFVFLADHKDRDTYLKENKTNNGKYNLILCQPRKKLDKARQLLRKTNYYSFWDPEYLDEILSA